MVTHYHHNGDFDIYDPDKKKMLGLLKKEKHLSKFDDKELLNAIDKYIAKAISFRKKNPNFDSDIAKAQKDADSYDPPRKSIKEENFKYFDY